MLLVASDVLGLPNIVDNHVQNFFTTLLLGQEVRVIARYVVLPGGSVRCLFSLSPAIF